MQIPIGNVQYEARFDALCDMPCSVANHRHIHLLAAQQEPGHASGVRYLHDRFSHNRFHFY